jgi:hypothetical protein
VTVRRNSRSSCSRSGDPRLAAGCLPTIVPWREPHPIRRPRALAAASVPPSRQPSHGAPRPLSRGAADPRPSASTTNADGAKSSTRRNHGDCHQLRRSRFVFSVSVCGACATPSGSPRRDSSCPERRRRQPGQLPADRSRCGRIASGESGLVRKFPPPGVAASLGQGAAHCGRLRRPRQSGASVTPAVGRSCRGRCGRPQTRPPKLRRSSDVRRLLLRPLLQGRSQFLALLAARLLRLSTAAPTASWATWLPRSTASEAVSFARGGAETRLGPCAGVRNGLLMSR